MPADSPAVQRPRIVTPASAAGGPTYEYRGAVIHSNGTGTNYTFKLDGFPHGPRGLWSGLGHIDTIIDLVNAWLDTGRLPPPYGTNQSNHQLQLAREVLHEQADALRELARR